MKKILLALIGAAFILTGCNTMSGMGRDIERGGEKIGVLGVTPPDLASISSPGQCARRRRQVSF